MNKIVNLSVVVVIACMMVAFNIVNIATYANEEVVHECVQCEKPADSCGGVIIVEHDDKELFFCCPDCVDKHKKGLSNKAIKDDKHHDPGKQKGNNMY